jgi:hypothetical protein
MRRKTMIPLVMPLLVLPLLGGCVSSDYLVAGKPGDPSAVEEITRVQTHKIHQTIAATRQTEARKFLANLS